MRDKKDRDRIIVLKRDVMPQVFWGEIFFVLTRKIVLEFSVWFMLLIRVFMNFFLPSFLMLKTVYKIRTG